MRRAKRNEGAGDEYWQFCQHPQAIQCFELNKSLHDRAITMSL